MSSALPVLQSLPEGSSGTGISYYSSAVTCSRRLRLDQEARASGRSDEGTLATNKGKIFHALADLYYSTGRKDVVVELPEANLGEASDEALRLFRGYAERFGPGDFARVVATEKQLPENENEEQARKLAEALGVSPFTCRLDMVVEVDSRSAEVLYNKRGLLVSPGVYLWDFKTKAAKNNGDELVYRHSPQFLAYQYVWNVLFPEMQCSGMIADCIVGHKKLTENSFYSVLVPPPTDIQIAGLKRWLAFAQKQSSYDEPNWLACFDFGRACPHLLTGACTRA